MYKLRPKIQFTVPDVFSTLPTNQEQLEQHLINRSHLLEYDNKGFPWVDAYFLAFGYNGIQPFAKFMEFAPNSISSLTGKPVVNEEDFLDVVYAQIELEQREQQLLDSLPETPKQGRPRLPEEVRLARSEVQNAKQARIDAIKRARKEREELLKEMWKEYQSAILARRESDAYHAQICADKLKAYQQLKAVTIDPDDF